MNGSGGCLKSRATIPSLKVERRDGQPFPRLLDFGLSRKATVQARLDGGTVGYVAPELYRAEDPEGTQKGVS